MDKTHHPVACDLTEVFAQLEKADGFTLRMAQVELARMQKDRERQESAGPLEDQHLKMHHQ